jgi:hypothetical protein
VAPLKVLTDGETFIREKTFIKARAPGRRMVYRRLIPSGNVVTLEATSSLMPGQSRRLR